MRARPALLLGALTGAVLVPAAPAGAHPAGDAPAHAAKAVKAPPRAARQPAPSVVTVRPGDTLWQIGATVRRTWAQLAGWNRLADPSLILVGQRLGIPPAAYTPPEAPPPAPRWQPPPERPRQPQTAAQAPQAPAQPYTPPRTVTPTPAAAPAGGSFQACVATRESGNGSGSSNIYGILDSTWASLGRSGSAWAATRAEQDAAFAQLYARDGSQPWAPYDGC